MSVNAKRRYAPGILPHFFKYQAILITISISISLILSPAVHAVAEKKLMIDLVEVKFMEQSGASIELSVVGRNLERISIPFWNKVFQTYNGTKQLVFGEVGKSAIIERNVQLCGSKEASSFIGKIRKLFYEMRNLSTTSDRYLVILLPRVPCIWEAIGSLNPVEAWQGGMLLNGVSDPNVISHELGHALGLGHSNLITCNLGKRDGSWNSECRGIEYGGAVDLMSNVAINSPLSSYHLWRLGLIPSKDVVEVWTNQQINLSSSVNNSGIRAIFIRDKDAGYWIEYRKDQPGSSIKPGVMISRIDPPPIAAIISPNIPDVDFVNPRVEISTDFWLINLDDYRYLNGKSAGSVTLQPGVQFSTKSGASTLEFTSLNPDQVQVNVSRIADTMPPPTPQINTSKAWAGTESSILEMGSEYEDLHSVIVKYEVDAGGEISTVVSLAPEFVPNYLNPVEPPKTVSSRDLPEGQYVLRVRAVDAWGNKSDWSPSVKVSIDRNFPQFTGEIYWTNINRSNGLLNLTGLNDPGSGICRSRLFNSLGFATGKSSSKDPNLILVQNHREPSGILEAVDCNGNGIRTSLSSKSEVITVNQMKKSGKWKVSLAQNGRKALECTGKCSASFSAKGFLSLLVGKSTRELVINSKRKVAQKSDLHFDQRVVYVGNLGAKKKLIRISGINLKLYAAYSLQPTFGEIELFDRAIQEENTVVRDLNQGELNHIGFEFDDFSADWSLGPILNGTTLTSPTLDFCSNSFASESERKYRRQLIATKNQSPYIFVSSEVVRYQSTKSANKALSELYKVIDDCLISKGFTDQNGIFENYEFQTFPGSEKKRNTIDGGIQLLVRIGSGNNMRWLLVQFQFENEFFSGVYIVKPFNLPFLEDELIDWLSVMDILGDRLNNIGSKIQ